MGRRTKSSIAKKPSIKKVLAVVQQQKKRTRTRPKTTRLGMIGKIAGGFWGPHGADLGRAAGNMISKITGMGDYKIAKNSISNGNSIPTFMSSADGMQVCHREFISDIVGTIAFSNGGLSLNPGLSNVFPFLSQLARNFEEYDFKGLVFEYRPTSGTAISTVSAALGVVVMATNYDAADPLFVNKQQMESYEFSNSTAPFAACIHPVECARNRNVLESLYVRQGPPAADTDIRLYDLGVFQLATAGMQSAYTVGELWVSYDCFLRKPRLNPEGPYLGLSWHATTGPSLSSGTNSNLLGTSPYIDGAGDTRILLMENTNIVRVLVTTPGTYLVSAAGTTVGSFTAGLNIAYGANMTQVPRLQARTALNIGPVGTGTTLFNHDQTFTVNATGSSTANYVTLQCQSNAALCMDITIMRFPGLTLSSNAGDRLPSVARRFSFDSFSADFNRLDFESDEKIDGC